MAETFAVHIDKGHLKFCAAHFMLFSSTEREPLHGHNYLVSIHLETSALDRCGCVIDFHQLKEMARQILEPLDHRLLLPADSPHLSIAQNEAETEIRFGDDRWIIPSADCILLPIANSTAELLAQYLGNQLLQAISTRQANSVSRLEIVIEETPGMSGIWFCDCTK